MPQEWVAFLREFGLPLTMLVILGVLTVRGVFVTGKSADARVAEVKLALVDLKAAHEREIANIKATCARTIELADLEKAYREERRLEERSNRLLTEEALRQQVTVMRDMTELMKDIERNLRATP